MNPFKKTLKQYEAINLLASKSKHVMLYGGSRSGKTFIICYAIIVRALKCESRHIVLRFKFNHAKTSIWLDTLPKVINTCFPDLGKWLLKNNGFNSSDYFIRLPNGSEIWVAGLDDKIRTEKILGKEYSTMFFNESSQIPYPSVTTAITRLAQKNALINKAYYDENPPQKSHWSYSLFILGKDPVTWKDKDTSKYSSLLMNPDDNRENIDEDYITDILDALPPRERDRFRFGKFLDAAEGAIYYAFVSNNHVKTEEQMREMGFNFNSPKKAGCDFNVDPITACMGYYENDIIYIRHEIFKRHSNTYWLADEIKSKWGAVDVFPDATGKARKSSATKTDHEILKDRGLTVHYNPNPHVKDRYNLVNGLLFHNRLFIHPDCKMLIKDLEQFTHDCKDDMLSHISDAMGYMCWGLARPQPKSQSVAL